MVCQPAVPGDVVDADTRNRRTLSKAQRKSYIKAVQCVQKTGSILPAGTSAGSKTLFDDFVYVHMMSTPYIHFTVSFLSYGCRNTNETVC